MNDREKETVEELKKQLRLAINIDDVTTMIRNDDAEAILNLIEKLQKENEELRAKWDKDTHILQNKLDYANADRIDLAQQNKESRKENEKLNNRCRNLDKEAQAYLEELAGDNTLTRRTIKQLQEENEELKYKIKGQECVIETQVHNEEVYESIFEKLEKENKELKK